MCFHAHIPCNIFTSLQFWDTGKEEDETRAKFDYDELNAGVSTTDHIAQQRVRFIFPSVYFLMSHGPSQMTFDSAHSSQKQLLKDRYKEGNHVLFPGKRIYTEAGSGFHWDLDDVKLACWASHMVREYLIIFLMHSRARTRLREALQSINHPTRHGLMPLAVSSSRQLLPLLQIPPMPLTVFRLLLPLPQPLLLPCLSLLLLQLLPPIQTQ